MARMIPRTFPAERGGAPIVAAAERRLYERLARELDAEWTVIHDCPVDLGGEGGSVDFVLVHREHGIALLTLKGRPYPDMVAAMRATLREIGFTARFPGDVAIVDHVVRPDAPGDLAEQLFAGERASAIADPTWPEWLIERLAARNPPSSRQSRATAAEPAPSLHAPQREDAWRVAAAAEPARAGGAGPATLTTSAPSRPVESMAGRGRWPIWLGMGGAILVVALVLIGMALLSHGNGTLHPT